MLAHTQKLSDLVLGRGDLGSAADFLRILDACPTLRALTIHEFYWPDAPPTDLALPLSTAYPRAGVIRVLRLERHKIAEILDGFRSHVPPSNCESSLLTPFPSSDDSLRMHASGTTSGSWASGLKRRTWLATRKSAVLMQLPVLSFLEHVDLRKNRCLEAFRLYNIAYRYDDKTPAAALFNIPQILRSLSSPSLVHISLTCELQLDEVSLLPWEDIDDILAIKNLRPFALFVVPKLMLHSESEENYESEEQYIESEEENRDAADGKMRIAIRERLPRLDALGMLKLPPERLDCYSIPRCTFHNSWHWGAGHDF
ncbi:hypothetical protein GGX14DRAFT_697912 [Mycena pura]|uniref:Uncharacterized protein n=1 Tax=Mycena pura TaxID=153505 RepID=A0AAD6YGM2_9AGAR|nr:hypothetical protein GGX14DRAFT_697912 [Mycena pura]